MFSFECIFLGEAKIDEIYLAVLFVRSEKIIRFDISMNIAFWVHVFDSLEHLICEHQSSFEGEYPFAGGEMVLERWSKNIDDNVVELSFLAFGIEVWNAFISDWVCAQELSQNHCFVSELLMFRFTVLQFNSHLVSSLGADRFKDFSKCPRPDFLEQFELPGNYNFHRRWWNFLSYFNIYTACLSNKMISIFYEYINYH